MSGKSVSRTDLPLKQKVELIKLSVRTGKSHRVLASEFGIGRTQVGTILKRKKELLEAYEKNEPDKKRRFTASHYDDIDALTWEWFVRVRGQNLPCSGPMIQEQALSFAGELGITDFKASNGWLASFKSRHNIVGIKLCGESASVSLETVDEWKGRLPSLLEDYKAENVFNLDETGLFFRATPDRSLAVKGSDCHGGKRSKDRLTVALACSMTGEVLKPLVIGRAAKPRCFRNLDITRLPVTYKNNRKSWMTSTLFDEWLNDINKKMRLAGRHILLFLDNAACHSANLVLSHVTLQFFPPNTTSKLQPLDQGIIQAFKVYYRHRLLHRLVAAVSAPDSTPTSAIQ